MTTPSIFEPERLLREIGHAEDFYAKRNDNFLTLNRWYFKDHAEWGIDMGAFPYDIIDNSEKEPVTPINLGTHMVDMAVTMSTQETPSIEVIVRDSERDPKKSMTKRGNIAEKVFMGVMYTNGQISGRSLLRDWFHNLYLYGWGVWFVGWDDSRVPDSLKSHMQKLIEAGEKSEEVGDMPASPDALKIDTVATNEDDWAMPVVIDVPHPVEIYPIPGGHRERWKSIFRKWTMRYTDAEDFFGVSLPRTTEATDAERAAEDDSIIDVVDFWTWVGNEIWHCIVAKNLTIYQRNDFGRLEVETRSGHFFIKKPASMPEYQRLPYEIRFCIPTTDKRGENYGLSLLYKVVDAIREVELLANREGMIIDTYADPAILRKADSSVGGKFPKIERGPGTVIDLDVAKGQDVAYLQWQGSPPDVKDLKEMWLSFAKEWGLDTMMEGKSGLDSIIIKSGILAKLSMPIGEAEEGLEAVHSRVVNLFVKLVGSPLKVRGRRTVDDTTHAYALDVTGSMLDGMQFAKFTIKARFPYEELQVVASANAAVTAKLMSRQRAMTKFMNVEDAIAELDRIEEEDIRLAPEWNTGLIQINLEKVRVMEMAELQESMAPQMGMAGMEQPQPGMEEPTPMGTESNPMMAGNMAKMRGLTKGGISEPQMANLDIMQNESGNLPQQMGRRGPGRPPLDESRR